MMSIIEVKCPHCGIHGQIMPPPLGGIIIGPCPNCDELVVVFCGQVLPLLKDIIAHGDIDQKAAHLRTVIGDYLKNKIDQVAKQLDDQVLNGLHDYYTPEVDNYVPQPRLRGSGPITAEEVRFWLNHEVTHIDEGDYFRRQFDDK